MARRTDRRTPRIDALDPQNLHEGHASALGDGGYHEGMRFDAASLAGAQVEALTLDGCRLVDADLDGARLDRLRLLDTVVEHVTAASMSAARSTLRDVRIEGSRFGAAEFFDAEWDRVELVGCRIDFLSLAGSRVRDLRIVDCTIGELDLRSAQVARAVVAGCRIGTLSVQDARLDALDLRGAELERIEGLRGLAGAIVSQEQLVRLAPLLAEELGISVE